MIDRSEKLLQIRYVVSMEPHIVLDSSKCGTCELRSCLYFCPAGCFKEENSEIKFNYEGCLECGTCRVMCPREALKWDYPLGGYGVSFRLG
ncbi:MAG: 4Fe-4S dicluster domain-containing protein [Dehalococcoidia bacterium]|nr:4Fe-4S dicluster domain-containing protein [Dehalococcoidia bacterium]